ncbi:unnamed protein product [Musa textilis]
MFSQHHAGLSLSSPAILSTISRFQYNKTSSDWYLMELHSMAQNV